MSNRKRKLTSSELAQESVSDFLQILNIKPVNEKETKETGAKVINEKLTAKELGQFVSFIKRLKKPRKVPTGDSEDENEEKDIGVLLAKWKLTGIKNLEFKKEDEIKWIKNSDFETITVNNAITEYAKLKKAEDIYKYQAYRFAIYLKVLKNDYTAQKSTTTGNFENYLAGHKINIKKEVIREMLTIYEYLNAFPRFAYVDTDRSFLASIALKIKEYLAVKNTETLYWKQDLPLI